MPEETPPIIITPPPPETAEEEEIDLVAELVASESIQREEQHDEVMEGIDQCRTQLQSLTDLYQSLSQSQTAENPMLADIQRQIAEVRTLQETLQRSMVSIQSSHERSDSIKTVSPTEEQPAGSDTESSNKNGESETNEPQKQEQRQPRRRFKKL